MEELEKDLKSAQFRAAGIHGAKPQLVRERTLREFRDGTLHILVATDLASRGLDVKEIRYVINYDFPLQVEDYVHRIGRTARAGAKGVAYSFFTKKDFSRAPELIKVLREANQEIPPELLDLAEIAGSTSSSAVFRKWKASPAAELQPLAEEEKNAAPAVAEQAEEAASESQQKKVKVVPKTFDNFFAPSAKKDEETGKQGASDSQGRVKKWGKK